jgi:ribosome recycling factor
MKAESEQKMMQAIDHFKEELKSLRTGRAHSGLVDGVTIELYGSKMRLKEVANVTTPDSKTILITPFDGKNAGAIGKSIDAANLGMRPIVDGNAVRLVIPAMDETIRKKMVATVHEKREATKVRIRNVRRELKEKAERQKKSGEIPEDLLKKFEKEIQEATDKFCKLADEVSAQKEKEIMTV